jgi:hypothetical protein
MITVTAKYVFWIVICLPVVFAGVWFSIRLFGDNGVINRELDEKKKAKELAETQRREFERSYRKKYYGDK